MSRLFISHSTNDKVSVERLIDFLVLGMGVARNDIFCTSQNGTFLAGEPFMEKIKEELKDCEKVICFITPYYLQSISCIAEMGAAWCRTGKIVPIIAQPLRYCDLNDTPLMGLQMLRHENEEDMTVLYEQLRRLNIATNERLVEFNRALSRYMNSQRQIHIIEKDGNGCYLAKIIQVRNTPPAYRCYKLDGLLRLDENVSDGETHWIFYKAGMYDNLKIGDTIKFTVESTELRDFPDLKKARNIYPESMEIL